MKRISLGNLEAITSHLTSRPFGSFVLSGKLELFSCSTIFSSDSLSNVPTGTLAATQLSQAPLTAPSSSSASAELGENQGKVLVTRRARSATIDESPPRKMKHRRMSLGDLGEDSSSKLLANLIEALNDFFPEYDFRFTKPDQFVLLDIGQCMTEVNRRMFELHSLDARFVHTLWEAINNAIGLKATEVFSYIPDNIDDPFSDGTIWSFNYFIVNKSTGRICYFTCIAKR